MEKITIKDLEEYRLLQNETIETLKEYKHTLNEVKRLSAKIEKLKANFEHSTVKGSSPLLHAKVRVFSVTGPGSQSAYSRTLQILEEREGELNGKIADVEAFISSIKSSIIRQIIECKYVQGLSWADTAKTVYGHADRTTPKKALDKYFSAKHKTQDKKAHE